VVVSVQAGGQCVSPGWTPTRWSATTRGASRSGSASGRSRRPSLLLERPGAGEPRQRRPDPRRGGALPGGDSPHPGGRGVDPEGKQLPQGAALRSLVQDELHRQAKFELVASPEEMAGWPRSCAGPAAISSRRSASAHRRGAPTQLPAAHRRLPGRSGQRPLAQPEPLLHRQRVPRDDGPGPLHAGRARAGGRRGGRHPDPQPHRQERGRFNPAPHAPDRSDAGRLSAAPRPQHPHGDADAPSAPPLARCRRSRLRAHSILGRAGAAACDPTERARHVLAAVQHHFEVRTTTTYTTTGAAWSSLAWTGVVLGLLAGGTGMRMAISGQQAAQSATSTTDLDTGNGQVRTGNYLMWGGFAQRRAWGSRPCCSAARRWSSRHRSRWAHPGAAPAWSGRPLLMAGGRATGSRALYPVGISPGSWRRLLASPAPRSRAAAASRRSEARWAPPATTNISAAARWSVAPTAPAGRRSARRRERGRGRGGGGGEGSEARRRRVVPQVESDRPAATVRGGAATRSGLRRQRLLDHLGRHADARPPRDDSGDSDNPTGSR